MYLDIILVIFSIVSVIFRVHRNFWLTEKGLRAVVRSGPPITPTPAHHTTTTCSSTNRRGDVGVGTIAGGGGSSNHSFTANCSSNRERNSSNNKLGNAGISGGGGMYLSYINTQAYAVSPPTMEHPIASPKDRVLVTSHAYIPLQQKGKCHHRRGSSSMLSNEGIDNGEEKDHVAVPMGGSSFSCGGASVDADVYVSSHDRASVPSQFLTPLSSQEAERSNNGEQPSSPIHVPPTIARVPTGVRLEILADLTSLLSNALTVSIRLSQVMYAYCFVLGEVICLAFLLPVKMRVRFFQYFAFGSVVMIVIYHSNAFVWVGVVATWISAGTYVALVVMELVVSPVEVHQFLFPVTPMELFRDILPRHFRSLLSSLTSSHHSISSSTSEGRDTTNSALHASWRYQQQHGKNRPLNNNNNKNKKDDTTTGGGVMYLKEEEGRTTTSAASGGTSGEGTASSVGVIGMGTQGGCSGTDNSKTPQTAGSKFSFGATTTTTASLLQRILALLALIAKEGCNKLTEKIHEGLHQHRRLRRFVFIFARWIHWIFDIAMKLFDEVSHGLLSVFFCSTSPSVHAYYLRYLGGVLLEKGSSLIAASVYLCMLWQMYYFFLPFEAVGDDGASGGGGGDPVHAALIYTASKLTKLDALAMHISQHSIVLFFTTTCRYVSTVCLMIIDVVAVGRVWILLTKKRSLLSKGMTIVENNNSTGAEAPNENEREGVGQEVQAQGSRAGGISRSYRPPFLNQDEFGWKKNMQGGGEFNGETKDQGNKIQVVKRTEDSSGVPVTPPRRAATPLAERRRWMFRHEADFGLAYDINASAGDSGSRERARKGHQVSLSDGTPTRSGSRGEIYI